MIGQPLHSSVTMHVFCIIIGVSLKRNVLKITDSLSELYIET